MNFHLKKFKEIKDQKLNDIDLEINLDKRIIRLNQLKQMIELEQEMIKREIKNSFSLSIL